MGIQERFAAYGDLVDEIELEQTRLYAKRRRGYAPSSPGAGGGSPMPGDRSGNAAAAIVDIEAHIRGLAARAAVEYATLDEIMTCLTATEKTMMRVRYFDRGGWELCADVLGVSVRGAQYIHDRAIKKMEVADDDRHT